MGTDKTATQANTMPTDDNGFVFELPPVSDKQSDFIDDIPDEYATETDGGFNRNDTSLPNHEQKSARGLVSSGGDIFDPSIHLDPPRETKTGKWRRKRKSDQEQTKETSNTAYQMEAQKLAMLYGQAHMIPFGQGGQVENNNHLLPLRDALSAYMAQHGLKEIPPDIAVLLTAVSYTATVAQRPQNKDKTAAFVSKFVGAYEWFKGKLFGRKSATILRHPTANKNSNERNEKPEPTIHNAPPPYSGSEY